MQEPNPPIRLTTCIATCKCGHTYLAGHQDNETQHDEIHEEFSLGPNIPEIQDLAPIASNGDLRLVVVDDSVEEPIKKAVVHVAEVAQRNMSDYPIGYDGSNSDAECRLYALIEGTRIVGIAITSIERFFWHMSWTSGGEPQVSSQDAISRRGPKIARVWVAESYRHRRLARWLIENVGIHLGFEVSDLGWEMPLTESGSSFVRSLCADGFLGCGEVCYHQMYKKS